NKIKSEVLVTERTLVSYFLNQPVVRLICNGPSPVAVISSSYVKSGQSVDVTAGIGQFSATVRPKITIDGKAINLSGGDIAEYHFVANGKPGKHVIPITYEITKPDGAKLYIGKKVEYIIAEN